MAEMLTAVASDRAAALQPDDSFTPLCEKLLSALDQFVRGQFPDGWRTVPFGSYVQDTCLKGAVLDVALVYTGTEVVGAWSVDMVDTLANMLAATKAFKRLPAAELDDYNAPIRLLAGDFNAGRDIGKQEINLYRGGHLTGSPDVLLRQLLETNPDAKNFVLLVKHWARSRGLTGPGRGGSFPWTMLAIFTLQTQGVLPCLRDIYSSDPETQLRPAPDHTHIALLRTFSDLVLKHGQTPTPRRRLSLWTGSLALEVHSHNPRSTVGRSEVVGELRSLQAILQGDPAMAGMAFPTLGWSSSSAGFGIRADLALPAYLTPPQIRPLRDAPAMESKEGHPPEVPQLPSLKGRSPGQQQQLEAAPGSTTAMDSLAELAVPPFPFKETDSPAAHATLCAASTAPSFATQSIVLPSSLKAPAPPPDARFASGVAPEAPESQPAAGDAVAAAPRRSGRNARWHVTEQWMATWRRADRIIEAVQLLPEARGLGRLDWERRFSRREHQIRIAKATEEYKKWQDHFARHGRQPSDPVTPRVVEQNSKRDFEAAYAQWRVQLHRDPLMQ